MFYNTYAMRSVSVLIAAFISIFLVGSGAYAKPEQGKARALSYEEIKQKIEKRRGKKTRIVNGEAAGTNEAPWQAAIIAIRNEDKTSIQDRYVCGGAFIDSNIVITAAHCVDGLVYGNTNYFRVLNGSSKLDGANMRTYEITDVLPHPRYDALAIDFDVALLRVRQTYTGPILALITPEENLKVYAGDNTLVTGWGLNEDKEIPLDMQKAVLPIIKRSLCNSAEVHDGEITSRMLCAGHLNGGADACFGDSGGPLVVKTTRTTKQTRLVGIVSWGPQECNSPGKVGVYARVIEMRDWIRDAIRMLSLSY